VVAGARGAEMLLIYIVFYFSVLTNIDYLHCYGFISYQNAELTAQMKSNSEIYLMFSPIE